MAITADDCDGAAEFWKHFEIEMPVELQNAFKTFKEDPSFENQNKIKLAVCKAIGGSSHEAFQDEMFKEVVEECKSIAYDLSFEESLESVLATQSKKEE